MEAFFRRKPRSGPVQLPLLAVPVRSACERSHTLASAFLRNMRIVRGSSMAQRIIYNWTYQSSRLGGWGESFANFSDDPGTVEQNARDLFDTLQGLHNPGAYCSNFSIRSAGGGLSRIVELNDQPKPAKAGTENDGDYITTSLLMFYADSTGRSIRNWISGIYDNWISGDGVYNPTPTGATAVAAFQARIIDPARGWCLIKQDPSRPKKVISAFNAGTGVVTITGHGLDPTLQIRLTRLGVYKQYTGKWWFVIVDANNIQLVQFTPSALTGAVPKGARAQQVFFTATQIIKSTVLRSTSHRRGRPFGQYTGRRKVVRRM
jgi:hypothetical protein